MDEPVAPASAPAPGAAPTPPPAPSAAGNAAAHSIGASKVYGKDDTEVHALREVSVAFERARFTAIMGPSGSGKSTLMQCMAGLDRLTGGETFIGDTALSTLNDRALTILRRTKVGFVFQAFNLVPTLNALENITLPVDLAGDQVDRDWLEQVVKATGLESRLDHRPNQLSGGQQQRVAVARALVSKPEIIFADEPTGNLDSKTSAEILDFMRRAVNELNQTIVMVTHDPFSASYSDRVLFLSDGRIVAEMTEPTPESVFDRIRSLGG